MTPDDELNRAVLADARTLLDTQLSNLSQRVFEVGKQADRQLTLWLSFAALTLLLTFGVTEKASFGGIEVKTTVGAAVAFVLSCIFYYRAALSMAALEVWRASLRERRALRFGVLLTVAAQKGPEVLSATRSDINGFISEFPGYVACSVLLKDQARRRGGKLASFVRGVHYAALIGFLLAPYGLAVAIFVHAGYAPGVIAALVLGLVFTLSGNSLIRFNNEGNDVPAPPPNNLIEANGRQP